jgi:hypothetical protein
MDIPAFFSVSEGMDESWYQYEKLNSKKSTAVLTEKISH